MQLSLECAEVSVLSMYGARRTRLLSYHQTTQEDGILRMTKPPRLRVKVRTGQGEAPGAAPGQPC